LNETTQTNYKIIDYSEFISKWSYLVKWPHPVLVHIKVDKIW